MTSQLSELDYKQTSLGELILRRRLSTSGDTVYEVKLDGSFLMSSIVNDSEIALADRALDGLGGESLDVLVGGLGLGYTAEAALKHANVGSVLVVEFLEDVIRWHREGLVPLGESLCADDRCRFVHGDFFAMSRSADGFDSSTPGRCFHAILVDIDHSPDSQLAPANASFYSAEGMSSVADRLHPGGIFALWSAEPPDVATTALLADVFEKAAAHPVTFNNPLLNREDVNTIYIGRKSP
jgi:spermidine synthase